MLSRNASRCMYKGGHAITVRPCGMVAKAKLLFRTRHFGVPCSSPRLDSQQTPNMQLIRFQDGSVEVGVEEELIQLPYDPLEVGDLLRHGHLSAAGVTPFSSVQMLGLTDRDVHLHCDITKAYDELLTAGIDDGYSAALLEARTELLDMMKELAIKQGGRVETSRRQVAIPVSLLPSALVLLAQLGYDDIVIEMATSLLENWEYRKVYKADLILALAMGYCHKARELLKEDQVAKGCRMLEEALHVLEATENIAPQLVKEIRSGLATLQGPRILDQLRAPLSSESQGSRRKAVQMLRALIMQPGADDTGIVTADYMKLLVGCMATHEILDMADWMEVVRKEKSLPWVYPGLLLTAATAHIVEGFVSRSPVKVKSGLKMMRGQAETAELLVLRGVGCLLLGATDRAAASFQAAAKAMPDAAAPWTSVTAPSSAEQHQQGRQSQQSQLQQQQALEGDEYAGAPVYGEDDLEPSRQELPVRLPDAVDAFAFITSNSPEAPGDLLPGMCLFTQLWLAKGGSPMFRNTQEQPPNPSINSYFSSQRVQVALETMQQQRNLGGPTSSIDTLGEALHLMQERMQQLAASGLDTFKAHVVPAAGGAATSLVNRVAGALVPAEAPNDDQPVRQLRSPSPEATPAPAPAAAAAGGSLAWNPAQQGAPAWQPESDDQRVNPVKAAVAAGLLLGAVVAGSALWRSLAGPAPTVAPAAAVSSRYPAMDVSGAARLIQQFQRSKARALGSEYDCSQLSSVLMGHALQQYTSTAQELAARGWFRTSRLWKCVVHQVQPLTASGQKVVAKATIGEEARTYGFDGQNTCSWNNAYDVDYEMTLCKGGVWRISRVTVQGREPDAGGFKLPFFGQQ